MIVHLSPPRRGQPEPHDAHFIFLQASKAIGGDDIEDSEDDMVQTLMELDYETCIDDEDEDEFLNFKTSLQGKGMELRGCVSVYRSPGLSFFFWGGGGFFCQGGTSACPPMKRYMHSSFLQLSRRVTLSFTLISCPTSLLISPQD